MQTYLIPGPQPRIEFSSRRERGFAEETGQIRNSLKKNQSVQKEKFILSLSLSQDNSEPMVKEKYSLLDKKNTTNQPHSTLP